MGRKRRATRGRSPEDHGGARRRELDEGSRSLGRDRRGRLAWAKRYERLSLTPGSVYWEAKRFAGTDVRGVLSSIHLPTLVLHRAGDPEEPVAAGRHLASHIPRATFVELDGHDHFPWAGDQASVLRALERFLATTEASRAELDRVLATVLFTDIVDSTGKAAELGDAAWSELLERHNALFRAVLAAYQGGG